MATRTVRVNGERQVVEGNVRVATLVGAFAGVSEDGVAVAVNGEIVPRARWHEREVRDGDDIEIVRAVQGG